MNTLAWRRRALSCTCVSLLLSGCPDDPIPTVTTSDSSGEGTTSDSMSTTAALDSSSGGGPASSSDGTVSETDTAMATTSSTTSSEDETTGPLPGSCGNNVIEGAEVCDLNQVNGETCQSLGYEGGQLGCLLNCEDYNLLGCFICGNEVIDIAEDCEGSVPEEVTCQSLGFEDGWISCGADCLYDLTECSLCGDGIRSGPEQCDGIDFGGQTCASVGFDSGNLACNLAQCAFVYSGCTGGMYVQDFEPSLMIPAELDVDVTAPWTVSDMNPIAGARSARSGNLPAGGVTNLTLQATFVGAGSVSFQHREDTASGWDYLRFYRDGVLQQSWTGNNAAVQYMAPVAAGNHTFQWRFERAGFANAGQNAVWVDDITLDGGVPL